MAHILNDREAILQESYEGAATGCTLVRYACFSGIRRSLRPPTILI
jgi:hypothetical protein